MKPIDLSQFDGATPGPWKCNFGNGTNLDGDVTVWGSDGDSVVAELGSDPSFPMANPASEMVANARLIASAPVLVSEVKALQNTLQILAEKTARANAIQHSGGVIEPEDWSELYTLVNEARALLPQ